LCWGWGLASFAASVANNTFNTVLLRYLTDVVGMSAVLAGTAIALSRVLDAVLHPAIGSMSDHSWTRWGRRRPYIVLGGLLCGGSILLVFNLDRFAGVLPLNVLTTGVLAVYGMAYAFVMVPTMAMAVDMTDDYQERMRLMSIRVYMVGAGQLIGSSVAPVLLAFWGGGDAAYRSLGMAMGAVTLVGCVVSAMMTKGARALRVAAPVPVPFAERVRTILSNRPFMVVVVVKLSFWLGVALTNGLSAYYTRYVLHVSDSWLGLYNLMKMVGWLGLQEGWVMLGRHRSKRFGFCLGAAILSATYASWFLGSGAWTYPLIILRGLLIGVGTGGIALNAQAMLPDTIEYDLYRSGLRREGLFSGIYSLAEMCAFSAGILCTSLVLTKGGYISAIAGHSAVQPESAVTAITLGYCLVPIAGSIISALALLLFYDLSPARMAQIGAVTRGKRPA
jgi:GPH family glycoside/pentoside/hexuronide:cation symporter